MFSKVGGSILHYFSPKSFYIGTKHFLHHQTHYDVLGLSKTCTTKEIKDAFIKLSKRYHPDKTKRKSSHTQFVKVAEAYNVLSKPDSRRTYDWELTHFQSTASDFYEPPRPTGRARGYSYDDPSFYANRDQSKDKYYERQPYYGVPGVRRVSNGVIALICIIFTAFGVSLQYFAIRYSTTLKREAMAKQSRENEEMLAKLQEEVNKNGNELQIELMEKRLIHDRNVVNDNIHDRKVVNDNIHDRKVVNDNIKLVNDRKLIHDRFYSQYNTKLD